MFEDLKGQSKKTQKQINKKNPTLWQIQASKSDTGWINISSQGPVYSF